MKVNLNQIGFLKHTIGFRGDTKVKVTQEEITRALGIYLKEKGFNVDINSIKYDFEYKTETFNTPCLKGCRHSYVINATADMQ